MNAASQRVLITGASGFVGKALCQFLIERGYSITAAVRGEGTALKDLSVSVMRLNLMQDAPKWLDAMRRVDSVVHLAANVHQFGADSRDFQRFHEVNAMGSRFAAQAAADAGVKRFVLLSSIKVNGEDSGQGRYNATDAPNPQDAYASSKLAAEIGVKEICLANDVQYTCIRPPLVYGPGVSANFLKLMQAVERGLPLPFKSIENKRSFVAIENLISFIEVCISHPSAAGTWLVSDNEDVSTPDLLRKLSFHLNCPLRLFSFPPRLLRLLGRAAGRQSAVDRLCGSLRVDAEPALNLLDWHPSVSLDQGLGSTTAAFRANQGRDSLA